jgi:predicted adenylyl cyclase CyaB
MPTNVEVKVRIKGNIEGLRERAGALAGQPSTLIRQEDTFFRTPRGRLKLRVPDTGNAELIYYERSDRPGPRPSVYIVARVNDAAALKIVLDASLGVRGFVRKQRELFLAGNTRIHIDDVEGLGRFLELEVMLSAGDLPSAASQRCLEIMNLLGARESDLVERAYIDLLEERAR